MATEIALLVTTLISDTAPTISHSRRYLALLFGMILGGAAHWVVIRQAASGMKIKPSRSRAIAELLSGALAALASGFLVLDRLRDVPLIELQYRLWFIMLISGFGGISILEVFYVRLRRMFAEADYEDEVGS